MSHKFLTAQSYSDGSWWQGLWRALRAEQIKLKNTLALWMVLIAPAVVVGLQTAVWLLQKTPAPVDNSAEQNWQLFFQAVLGIWSILMLPLYVTLQAALIAGIDHQEKQWKHLLTLPVARSALYLAKLITLMALVALAILVLLIVLIPFGAWLVQFRDGINLDGARPWRWLWKKAAVVLACAALMIVIQYTIAMRWRSFTLAVSTGMSATVMGFIIGQSQSFGPWFPWTMPIQVLTSNPDWRQVLWVSVIGASVLSIVGAWEFSRREFFD